MRQAIMRGKRETIRELYSQSPQIIRHINPSLFHLATLYLREDSLDELCKLWDQYASTLNQGKQLSSIYSLEERRSTVDWFKKFAEQVNTFNAKNSWTLFDLFEWANDMLTIHNDYAAAMEEAQRIDEYSVFNLTSCNIFKLGCWNPASTLKTLKHIVETSEELKNMLQLNEEQRECIWLKDKQMRGGKSRYRYIIAEMIQDVERYIKTIKIFVDFPEKHDQLVLPRLNNTLSDSIESLHLTASP